MGLRISSLLKYEVRPLDSLRTSERPLRVAIDLMPLIHMYHRIGLSVRLEEPDLRYNGYRPGQVIPTSHVMGVLGLIRKMRKRNMVPLFCMDSDSTPLKKIEVERRKTERARNLEKVKSALSSKRISEEERLELLQLHQGPKKRDVLLLMYLLGLMGYPVYSYPSVEAQKLCAHLVLKKKADVCYSRDTDTCMYGVSSVTHFDFPKEECMYLNLEKTLRELGLTQKQLVYVSIAAGTDFSKGINKIGPKIAYSRVKNNFLDFQADLYQNIPNFEQIRDYFLKCDSDLEAYISEPHEPEVRNTEALSFLKGLGFSDTYLHTVWSQIMNK